MGKIDTNKKLELVRSIRMSQLNNRAVLNRREQLLYGTGHPLVARGELYSLEAAALDGAHAPLPETAAGRVRPLKSFKIRLITAVLLFGAFLFLDRSGQSVMGVTTGQIYEAIRADGMEAVRFVTGLFTRG